MTGNIVINSALRATIHSINQAQRLVDQTTVRLSTGKEVNSAIDNPKNFFTSTFLTNRAGDFTRLLDGIGQSIRTIEEGLIGTEAVYNLLEHAESVAIESQKKLLSGIVDPSISVDTINTSGIPLNTQILADNPVAYWRLDDVGNPAVNLGTGGPAINGTYAGGVVNQAPELYTNGANPSAEFDGINDIVNIPDSALINTSTYAQRTVELVFNADNTGPRQVLYEEGATVNGLTIYIDGGSLYVTGEDDGAWVDANINAPINTGQTYHVAFVYDRTTLSFTGYLDGTAIGSVPVPNINFPSHSGNIGIGAAPDGVQFHDGESGAGGFNFDGRISDVAIYNTALDATTLAAHSQSTSSSNSTRFRHNDFNAVLDQVDQIVIDANYRGVNLLAGEDLTTSFNEDRSNTLVTEGVELSSSKLGIGRFNFNDPSDLQNIIDSVRAALLKVRSYGNTLHTNINIIKTRSIFTEELINTHLAGADDLTLADINEESANQLANQTRQQLGTAALKFASESQAAVLRLVNNNNS